MLRKRSLTNLYNQRPAWLDQAHARLDAAVADACGDDEILARVFALDQARGSRLPAGRTAHRPAPTVNP